MPAPSPIAPPSNLTGRVGISAVGAADVACRTGRTTERAAAALIAACLAAFSAGDGFM